MCQMMEGTPIPDLFDLIFRDVEVVRSFKQIIMSTHQIETVNWAFLRFLAADDRLLLVARLSRSYPNLLTPCLTH